MIFQTSDFLTAITIMLLKHRLIDIKHDNPRRAVFEFEWSTKLEEDVESLKKGELLVDPADFWAAERRCKQLIYGGKRL